MLETGFPAVLTRLQLAAVLAVALAVACAFAAASGMPSHAGRCLSGPHPIYHPYNRAGNGAWRMTLAFVPACHH